LHEETGMVKKLLILIFVCFLLAACAGVESQIMPGTGPYNEWLSTCKDYKDVQKFFDGDNPKNRFRYDSQRLQNRLSRSMPVYPPWITFEKRSGVCSDASVFAKYSLNKIYPEYKAEILFLDDTGTTDHFVCVFHLNDKLYIMDYGTTLRLAGTFGPYNELKEYVEYYSAEKNRTIERYYYGWPAGRKETW
jgi:hypothetical protein